MAPHFKAEGEASPAESSVVGGAKSGMQSIAIYRKHPRRREGGGACAPVSSRGLAGDDVMQCSLRSLISSAGFSAVHTDHSSGVAAPSEILPPVLNIHAVLSGLRRPRVPSPSPVAASSRQRGESIPAIFRDPVPLCVFPDRANDTTFHHRTYTRRSVGVNIRLPSAFRIVIPLDRLKSDLDLSAKIQVSQLRDTGGFDRIT